MCGIAGVLHPDPSPVPAGEVERMTEVLAHRGPDGHGVHREPGVALGHRRLNVIDIDGGSQPMSNEDGTVWVTFNGEIYNFQSLRRELTARGHVFASRCDTEVLVHGYEQWGDELVEHLSGMFAFAIWDSARRRALLARDRMGQKPLCYAHLDDGRLIFGSEAKALVAHPDFDPAVDSAGLAAYLTYEYLPTTLSMFRGVRRLLPGHVLTYDGGALSSRRYWDIPFDNRFEGTYADAEQRFSHAFDKAVRRRLVADVPLGVFLSGGIDSSAVAAVAVQHQTTERVKTFSIGFRERSFDESSYARNVAQYLGTDHHDRIFDADALLDTLPRVLQKLDEPFGDATDEGVFAYFKAIAEAVSIPVVLYTNPNFQRSDLSLSVIDRLSRIPNIGYIKDASFNTGRLLSIINRVEGRMQVFAASAHIPTCVMLIGGIGWMSGPACVAPRQSVELYELCLRGDWVTAMERQRPLWKLNQAFAKYNLAACIKGGLQLQGYPVGAPLPPQAPLSPEGVEEVRRALVAIGAL